MSNNNEIAPSVVEFIKDVVSGTAPIFPSLEELLSVDLDKTEPESKEPITLQDYVDDNYKAAKKRWGAFATNTINYLRQLCSINRVALTDVIINDYVQADGRILQKRSSVNKRFFEKLDTSKSGLDVKQIENVTELILKSYKDQKATLLAEARTVYTTSLNTLNNAKQRYLNEVINYKRNLVRYEGISREPVDSALKLAQSKSIVEELSNPFWELITKEEVEKLNIQTHSRYVYLRTAEVHLSFKDRKDEAYFYTVNLGKFIVRLNPSNGDIEVRREFRYPDADSFEEKIGKEHHNKDGVVQHPFLGSGDRFHKLCYGAEEESYGKYLTEQDFGAALSLTRQILTTYDEGSVSPYYHLWDELRDYRNNEYLKWRFTHEKRNEIKHPSINL